MGKIIIVNGRQYYEATGLPVEDSPATHIRENESSANIHQGVQKSQTLNRRFVKQPKSRTVEQIQQIQQFKRKHDYEEAKKRAEEMNATAARLRVASAPKITRFNPGEGSANRVVTPIKRAPETKPALQEAQPTPHPIQQKIETAKKSIDVQEETFLFNNNLANIEIFNEIEKLKNTLKTDDEIIQLRSNIKKASEAKVANGTMTVTDLLRDINNENQARQNRSLHEIQLYMTVYQLKNNSNI